MRVWRGRGISGWLAVFGIAMAGLVVWAYWRFGVAPLTALAFGIAIGCFGAMFYAWRLAHRLPPQKSVRAPPGKERP